MLHAEVIVTDLAFASNSRSPWALRDFMKFARFDSSCYFVSLGIEGADDIYLFSNYDNSGNSTSYLDLIAGVQGSVTEALQSKGAAIYVQCHNVHIRVDFVNAPEAYIRSISRDNGAFLTSHLHLDWEDVVHLAVDMHYHDTSLECAAEEVLAVLGWW